MSTQKQSVTVKDVPADKFIAAYAELLKRSGKVRSARLVSSPAISHTLTCSHYHSATPT